MLYTAEMGCGCDSLICIELDCLTIYSLGIGTQSAASFDEGAVWREVSEGYLGSFSSALQMYWPSLPNPTMPIRLHIVWCSFNAAEVNCGVDKPSGRLCCCQVGADRVDASAGDLHSALFLASVFNHVFLRVFSSQA